MALPPGSANTLGQTNNTRGEVELVEAPTFRLNQLVDELIQDEFDDEDDAPKQKKEPNNTAPAKKEKEKKKEDEDEEVSTSLVEKDLLDDALDLIIEEKVQVDNDQALLMEKLMKIDITQLDKSGSHEIDRKQFLDYFTSKGIRKEAADNIFDELDNNGDGTITAQEYNAWLTAKSEKMKKAQKPK